MTFLLEFVKGWAINNVPFKFLAVSLGKLLKKMNFSLRSNSKKISNGGKKSTKEEAKKRNKQFEFIKKPEQGLTKRDCQSLALMEKRKT